MCPRGSALSPYSIQVPHGPYNPELSRDSCGGEQPWYVSFYFHSKHPSWDHPNKLSILFSTKALALSRNVFRTKQIAKANILFLSARPAKHCNISRQDFQGNGPLWWTRGTRHAVQGKGSRSGHRGGGHPHTRSLGVVSASGRNASGVGGFPLLPAASSKAQPLFETNHQLSSALLERTHPVLTGGT